MGCRVLRWLVNNDTLAFETIMDSQLCSTPEQALQQPKGTAYSYVRFSTVKQHLGDSLRRQVEMAGEYCTKHGLVLHPVSYRDLGVSAFKRKNLEKGALAAFIQAVRDGKIAKGSFLVIEQFDRLSRADTNKALRLLLDLVDAGIKVVTLVDEKVWDSETITDTGNLILAIVYMSRANNESAAKAKRLTDVWGEKKRRAATGEGLRIVTSECPRWLAPNAEKTGFLIKDEIVESIRKVFEMRINGYGICSIVTRANKEGWPVPGKHPVQKSGESLSDFTARADQTNTWHTSNVGRLLKNRALLGEYQPHKNDPDDENKRYPSGDPVLNYYPPVIDETTFLRAQAKVERSGRFPGRRDASLKNWLQGLLRCGVCGRSFVRKNKNSKAQPEYARYYCTNRNLGKTNCPSSSAIQLEDAVLTIVSIVAPQYFSDTGRTGELKARVDLLSLELANAQHARDRFLDVIGETDKPSPQLRKKYFEAENKVSELQKLFAAASAEFADVSGDFDNAYANIFNAVKSVDSLDARAALREELSRIIEKAVVHQEEGLLEIFLRGGRIPILQPLDPENYVFDVPDEEESGSIDLAKSS